MIGNESNEFFSEQGLLVIHCHHTLARRAANCRRSLSASCMHRGLIHRDWFEGPSATLGYPLESSRKGSDHSLQRHTLVDDVLIDMSGDYESRPGEMDPTVVLSFVTEKQVGEC